MSPPLVLRHPRILFGVPTLIWTTGQITLIGMCGIPLLCFSNILEFCAVSPPYYEHLTRCCPPPLNVVLSLNLSTLILALSWKINLAQLVSSRVALPAQLVSVSKCDIFLKIGWVDFFNTPTGTCNQDLGIYCMDKCRNDSWYLFKLVPGTYLTIVFASNNDQLQHQPHGSVYDLSLMLVIFVNRLLSPRVICLVFGRMYFWYQSHYMRW